MRMRSSTPRVLITGITGQDGQLLARHLLAQGQEVLGGVRPGAVAAASALSLTLGGLELVETEFNSVEALRATLAQVRPDRVFHLAAQTAAGTSWSQPLATADVTALGAHRLFEALRLELPACRVFQASSSEMFGVGDASPKDEGAPLCPVNPYAVAKTYAHHMAGVYRRQHGLFVACGILFNHESPLRGQQFVTQKVAHGAACARLGVKESPLRNEAGEPMVRGGRLALGNLDTARDWCHAADVVLAMAGMLETAQAGDYVIGSGSLHSLRQLCAAAYGHVALNWEDHVVADPRFLRPAETAPLVANPAKAARELGWRAQVGFADMIAEMVDAQLAALQLQLA